MFQLGATRGGPPSSRAIIRRYAVAHRTKRVRNELEKRSKTVTEAIYDAGFNSGGRFYETSDQLLDMTPTDYRAGGADTEMQALREIPVGSTASYTEIAARIGAPNGARAVARACGANALAVAIPCHRVVSTDGSLSGYRWGVERKRNLLKREGVG